jgi:hypothetical protein
MEKRVRRSEAPESEVHRLMDEALRRAHDMAAGTLPAPKSAVGEAEVHRRMDEALKDAAAKTARRPRP